MRAIIAAILALLCSMSVSAQSNQKDLSLRDIYGRAFKLSDYNGKVVLLNFWATWCPPCRTEILDLIRLQREYRKAGLQIIGITYPPEKLASVRAFARTAGTNYPLALGSKSTKSTFTSSDVLPITVVVGRDGNVREVIEGILLPEEFDEKIKPLLVSASHAVTQASETPKYVKSQRETIRITSTGYSPSSIRLRRGIKATLTFIRSTEQTCGTELRIPAYAISRSLPLNENVSVSFTPSKSGRFKITCGMDMFRGTIVVR